MSGLSLNDAFFNPLKAKKEKDTNVLMDKNCEKNQLLDWIKLASKMSLPPR